MVHWDYRVERKHDKSTDRKCKASRRQNCLPSGIKWKYIPSGLRERQNYIEKSCSNEQSCGLKS